MQTRLYEIRKRKGLTLKDIAERVQPKTTIQTIGRLEKNERKMTLDWLYKIAKALECTPGELMPTASGSIPFVGMLTRGGHISPTTNESMGLQVPGEDPIAIKLAIKVGDLEIGDTLICDRSTHPDFQDCLNRDCLVTTADGQEVFGHLIAGSRANLFTVILGGEVVGVLTDIAIKSAARRIMLIRYS
ncbi:helix-turn-helix domain-containing protein [Govanella unica]|uniref:Helix-turn-helix transcriptional regulator n=1 Tax=Govanella unica TaxID=2975056 RepID=A0A9X3U0T1_9PROT|nr:helix-turn-helix transcriptional regulator [Govania unica]MDA5194932.1 helix-turn-helix transcriptional regulator [Govania unica]